jgi:vancomycin resistance protein YoaR
MAAMWDLLKALMRVVWKAGLMVVMRADHSVALMGVRKVVL